MNLLSDFLVKKKGLERIDKKSVIQFAVQGLVAFSISEGKHIIKISFPLFKDETGGKYRTAKANPQRDKFIEICEGEERVSFNTNAPVGTFESEQEAIDFLKYNRIVELAKEYSEFKEVNSDYELSETQVDGVRVQFRSNIPTESEIVRDVFIHKEYERKGLVIEPGDVVLDLGANIGCFSLSVFNHAKKIISFEPEEVNYSFLEKNIKLNKAKNIIPFKKAVIGTNEKTKDFYVGRVPYYYSFLVKNNRKRVTVECVNINDLIKTYNPTKMKIDIEGSEREVMMSCTDFGRVSQIIFEYNFDMNKDLENNFENFNKLAKHLKKHGFDVSALDKYSRSKSWAEVFLVNRIKK